MQTRQEYDHNRMQGSDVDIETALKEYGLAWIETDKDILFYYGIMRGFDGDNHEYTQFDFCSIDKDIDIKEEYDWMEFDRLESFVGHGLMEYGLIGFIEAALHYYGSEEVFGASYWEGLTYNEIVKERG